jgi:hypothetical protein
MDEEVEEFSPEDKQAIYFHDFVTIKFESFVNPKEVKIYEVYNPGIFFSLLINFIYLLNLKQIQNIKVSC